MSAVHHPSLYEFKSLKRLHCPTSPVSPFVFLSGPKWWKPSEKNFPSSLAHVDGEILSLDVSSLFSHNTQPASKLKCNYSRQVTTERSNSAGTTPAIANELIRCWFSNNTNIFSFSSALFNPCSWSEKQKPTINLRFSSPIIKIDSVDRAQ